MIDSAQIRAARAMLVWTIEDLSKQAKVAKNHISSIERDLVKAPRVETINKLQEAFENAGIVFLPGGGVRRNNNIDRESERIEIIHAGGEPLRIITAKIHDTQGDILVYGRGTAGFNTIQEEYMKSIVEFLKHKPYRYIRTLLISSEFPETSYLWLLFMRKMLLNISLRDRITLRVVDIGRQLPIVYTPIQAIGINFFHFSIGSLSFNPERHINEMSCFLVYVEYHCEYFVEFIREGLPSFEGISIVNHRNINDLVSTYKEILDSSNKDEGYRMSNKVEEFVDTVYMSVYS
ncbi:MAG: hypothetical protein ETSY2_26705 [Candidatus Entotheonella gemina]|uniref:HTH cro/C1-type domain-containing protein n=1 Tax=Candidatus Entotheonella gemina TaxID=1429439 RepID=W4M4G1_9BACT|nr:MAG: hypothetical protein ETSY2_26705 [Candidatus Entotheonella gemina]